MCVANCNTCLSKGLCLNPPVIAQVEPSDGKSPPGLQTLIGHRPVLGLFDRIKGLDGRARQTKFALAAMG